MLPANTEDLHTSDLFKSIVDNLPTSIFVKDSALRLIYANKACVERIGLPLENILGKTDDHFFAPEEARVFMERDRQVIASGEKNYTEEPSVDQDGTTRMWATTKARFEAGDGKAYLMGGQFEVTEQRKQQENLKIAAEQTETVIELLRSLKILALNAAIEAARIGSSGAGFSVLASEMRALAEKTDAAAKNIRKTAA